MLQLPVSGALALMISAILIFTPVLHDQVATPDAAAIPAATAPLGLGHVTLPDDPGSVEALFRHLPDTVASQPANVLHISPDRIRASYGAGDAPFGPPLQLGAISLDRSDFFPPSFTPGDYVAMNAQFGDGGTTTFGRDGILVWISGETTVGAEGDRGGTPVASQQVYTLVWGVVDGSWLFTAAARTPEGRDALVSAFVDVALSQSGTSLVATPCADPDLTHC